MENKNKINQRMKESYGKVRMSRDARERIYTEIMDSEEAGNRGAGKERRGNQRGRIALSGWKVALAACLGLALIIPTGVYAAGKISRYLTVTIGGSKYQAEIRMNRSDGTLEASGLSGEGDSENKGSGHQGAESEASENKGSENKISDVLKKPEKYIRVKADFGKDYRYQDCSIEYEGDEDGNVKAVKCEIEEGTDGTYNYSHRDGFHGGKDFYYDVIYMDVGEDAILKLYDKALVKEITVNGHKALLCQANTVQGSQYASDYDTDYTLDVYVFYQEYGYVIDFRGMQGLGKEKLTSLAESVSVTEAKKEQASRYEYLSRLQRADQQHEEEVKRQEILSPVKGLNQKVSYEGLTCQVTDVSISSDVKDKDLKKYNDDFFTEKSGYWDGKGKLKPYVREKIKRGDGVSQPGMSVAGTEKVQPKMVCVTVKVKAERKALFELPMVRFLEKEKGRYYDNRNQRYWQYNRPEKIEDALIDFMPCYFKETAGGKGFWLKEMEKGEEQVYHFAYMVDEDMTDDMVLLFDANNSQSDIKYVDLFS